jgi:hypothetical protein
LSKEEHKEHGKHHRPHQPKYIWAIVVNLVVLYIFNNLQNWHVPILTDSWVACLWILNISITATIAANILWLFYHEDWFRALLKVGLNLISFIFLYVLYKIFPFNFFCYGGNTTALVFRIVIIIGLVGLVIGTIVELFHFIYYLGHSSTE